MRVKRYEHFLAESAAFRKSVLAEFARGASQAEISRKFSISRQRVNQIVWPKADKARIIVSKQIRAKKLIPANKKRCMDCGKKATAYDHRDYSKPLKVDPVCGACNNKRGQGKNGS